MEDYSEKNGRIEPCNNQCSFCFLNYVDVLEKNYLFRNLNTGEVGQIIKSIHHQVKRYEKGDLIAGKGDKCESLRIIVKGAVVGEMTDFQGKILRIEELKAPDTIATAFIFGDNNKLPVNIIALEETKLLLILKQDLINLLTENKIILKNYLDIISNRTQHLSKQIKLLGLQKIRGKIAYYLLEQLSIQGSTDLVIKNTQTELANMFGVSRPSLARVIRELHNDGVISAVGKRITILDKKTLSGFLR